VVSVLSTRVPVCGVINLRTAQAIRPMTTMTIRVSGSKTLRFLIQLQCPVGDACKDSDEELSDTIHGTYKAVGGVCSKSLEDKAKSQNDFDDGEEYANNSL
jgi:hypothetical protein